MSSFGNAKTFVSRAILNENEETPTDTNDIPEKQQNYDPRTLYERLREQRTLKDEAFQEANRASNFVKRLDDDEAEFYQTLSDTQSKLLSEAKRKENEEVREFRRAVEEARATSSTLPSTQTHTTRATKPSRKAPNKALSGLVVVKKKRDLGKVDKEETKAKKSKTETETTKTSEALTKAEDAVTTQPDATSKKSEKAKKTTAATAATTAPTKTPSTTKN